MKAGGFCVFEAWNHARKEILVGVTTLAIPEFIRGRKDNLPVEVSHWGPTEELSIRRLTENMPVQDAWQFVALYAFYIEKGDWRIIRQTPPEGDRP
ncbi:MAG: hypothetical protein ACHQ2Z_05495 [Elusimicrobiota bacterium]